MGFLIVMRSFSNAVSQQSISSHQAKVFWVSISNVCLFLYIIFKIQPLDSADVYVCIPRSISTANKTSFP